MTIEEVMDAVEDEVTGNARHLDKQMIYGAFAKLKARLAAEGLLAQGEPDRVDD